MKINGYQGQIRAIDQPDKVFHGGENLFLLIKQNANFSFSYIYRIGIQVTKNPTYIFMGTANNVKKFQIGKTGIFQQQNTQITQLFFQDDTNKDVVIDYILK